MSPADAGFVPSVYFALPAPGLQEFSLKRGANVVSRESGVLSIPLQTGHDAGSHLRSRAAHRRKTGLLKL